MTGIYRYVKFDRIESFVQMGWMLGGFASHYSVFMFACACNPEGRAPI
jgi:hypothetical protein